jgi:hypothetical protein
VRIRLQHQRPEPVIHTGRAVNFPIETATVPLGIAHIFLAQDNRSLLGCYEGRDGGIRVGRVVIFHGEREVVLVPARILRNKICLPSAPNRSHDGPIPTQESSHVG